MEEPLPGSNKWETTFAIAEIKDNILYITYKKGISIYIDDAKEMIRKRLIFTQNVAYPMLVQDEGIGFIAKDARDFMSKEGTEGVVAGAIK